MCFIDGKTQGVSGTEKPSKADPAVILFHLNVHPHAGPLWSLWGSLTV